jgi:hypothetical protein
MRSAIEANDEHRLRTFLALGGIVLAMCLSFLAVSPGNAQADGWTNYCNGQKLGGWNETWPPYPYCYGAARWYGSVMGEGDQHSVCPIASNDSMMCTTGPGAWVYNPGDGVFRWREPSIYQNSGIKTWTIVHAVAWTQGA